MPFGITRIKPELLINDEGPGIYGSPEITALADGGYVISWETYIVDTFENDIWKRNKDIRQRVFDANGNPLGPETPINEPESGIHGRPLLKPFPSGGYVVIWETSYIYGDNDIYQRVYDAQGNPLGPPTLANEANTADDRSPVLLNLPDGGYRIVWSSTQSGISSLYQRIFDKNGNPKGSVAPIDGSSSAESHSPSVCLLPDGGYAAMWSADSILTLGRFNAAGELVGDHKLLMEPGIQGFFPNLTALANGRFVASWFADETWTADFRIHMRIFDSKGDSIGEKIFPIHDRASDWKVTALPNGSFVLTWGNYQRLFASDGTALTQTRNIVANVDPNYNTITDVTVLADGSYSILTDFGGVQWHHFNENGRKLETVEVSSGGYGPKGALLASGAFATTWGFKTDAGRNVAAQRLYGTETLQELTAEPELVIGTDGNDVLSLRYGTLTHGDVLSARNGVDTMQFTSGGLYDLTIPSGIEGFEVLLGSIGNDTVIASASRIAQFSSIDLGKGQDKLYLKGGTFSFSNVTLNGVEQIVISSGTSAKVTGSVRADIIIGASRNDTVVGGGGYDSISGGAGKDSISGEAGRDSINGGAGNDSINGGTGNDSISGGDGNDRIGGGEGFDKLRGGSGKDTFLFDTKVRSSNVDVIYDFSVKYDTIYLDNSFFKSLGSGSLRKPIKVAFDTFYIGSTAHDSNDRIIYNHQTGNIYYDPDGTGYAPMVRFAKLKKHLKLTNADFYVV